MPPTYTRALAYRFPLIRGEDVLALQLRLRELGFRVAQPDGVVGPLTEVAIRQFQQSRGLSVDGVVGPLTWNTLFQAEAAEALTVKGERIRAVLAELTSPHSYRDGVAWLLTTTGISVGGDGQSRPPETTGGEPTTVRRAWENFEKPIELWSTKLGVPVELIIATICTESGGNAAAVRTEPGYVSDETTPNKVSPGLMQTLISTARDTLGNPSIDRAWLLSPENAIRAGTAYIASQSKITHLDPPKVACAYNAGGVYYNAGPDNRWKMRQYPINTSHHADRFVQWFNDCFVMFKKDGLTPAVSFYHWLQN